MKKYFYCQSYQAFSMALLMSLSNEVIVITSTENILKACKLLKIKYIEHKIFKLKDFIIKKVEVIKEILRLLSIVKEDEIHFSHTQFAVFCFLLVDHFNKKGGKTYFHNFEFVYPKPNLTSLIKKTYIYYKFYQILLKIFYKIPLEVRMSTSNSFMISLNLKYIFNNSNLIDNKDTYYNEVQKFYFNYDFEYPKIENLFIAQTFTNYNLFREEKIKELLPVINNEKIYVKNHPKLGKVPGLEKCKELPDFLPVELFFNKVTNCVFSFHSASLIVASKFENCKTVSLLDIVKQNDPFLDEVKLDLQNKSDRRIIFPKSIEELKFLVS